MQRIEGMREDSFMFIVTGSNQANSVSTVTVQRDFFQCALIRDVDRSSPQNATLSQGR